MEHDTIATLRTYGATLAHSLIHFAEQHKDFAARLAGLLALHNLPDRCAGSMASWNGPGIALPNENIATRRALWLMDALEEKRVSGHQEAEELLAAWARARAHEEKSFIILGLKAGVLNYGVFGHPSKRYEPMDILVREDIAQAGVDLTLTRTLTSLTHTVVERGLVLTGGKTAKLEPELGDWLFGDKSLALYRAPQKALVAIEAHAEELGVFCASHTDDRGIAVLALSPTLYLSDMPQNEALTPLE